MHNEYHKLNENKCKIGKLCMCVVMITYNNVLDLITLSDLHISDILSYRIDV